MRERRGVPRACEQIDGGAGLGDQVGVLVAVLDEGMVRDAERVLVVVEVELIIGQALGAEPVLGAGFGLRVTAGDQRDLIAACELLHRGLRAWDDLQGPARLDIEDSKHLAELLLGDSVGHVVVLGHLMLFQRDPVQLPEQGPQTRVRLRQDVVNVHPQDRPCAFSHDGPPPANSFKAASARRRTSALASLSVAVRAGLAASPPNLPSRKAASTRTPGSGSVASTLLSGATVSGSAISPSAATAHRRTRGFRSASRLVRTETAVRASMPPSAAAARRFESLGVPGSRIRSRSNSIPACVSPVSPSAIAAASRTPGSGSNSSDARGERSGPTASSPIMPSAQAAFRRTPASGSRRASTRAGTASLRAIFPRACAAVRRCSGLGSLRTGSRRGSTCSGAGPA